MNITNIIPVISDAEKETYLEISEPDKKITLSTLKKYLETIDFK